MDHPHHPHHQHAHAQSTNEFHPFPTSAQDEIERRLRQEVDPPASNRPAPRIRESQLVQPTLEIPAPPASWSSHGAVVVDHPSVTPMSEVYGDSIPLPSQFFWYPFKDLYVRPLRVPHLAKINAANETGNLQPLVEAVSSCLVTPGGHKDVAMHLGVQDWIAVLYHLKFNSFNKRGITLTWDCTTEEHLKAHTFWAAMDDVGKAAHRQKVQAMSDADRRAAGPWVVDEPPPIRNKSVVDHTTLRTNFLKTAPDPAQFVIDLKGKVPSSSTHARMRPETVLDSIQFMDLPDWENDAELQWLAQQAAFLEVLTPDGTLYPLSERIEMIRSEQLELTVDEFTRLQEFQEIMGTFGVEEFVQVRCMGCGASTLVRSNVDAATFLTKDI